jgi:hypothetical protein
MAKCVAAYRISWWKASPTTATKKSWWFHSSMDAVSFLAKYGKQKRCNFHEKYLLDSCQLSEIKTRFFFILSHSWNEEKYKIKYKKKFAYLSIKLEITTQTIHNCAFKWQQTSLISKSYSLALILLVLLIYSCGCSNNINVNCNKFNSMRRE